MRYRVPDSRIAIPEIPDSCECRGTLIAECNGERKTFSERILCQEEAGQPIGDCDELFYTIRTYNASGMLQTAVKGNGVNTRIGIEMCRVPEIGEISIAEIPGI